MSNQALSTEEPKEKLQNLRELLPNADELVYGFGLYLTDYIIQPQLNPKGFALVCALALSDLRVGSNGYTGKPIPGELVGLEPAIYEKLQMEIPNIAAAVFPAHFAEDVKTFMDEVNASIREKRSMN